MAWEIYRWDDAGAPTLNGRAGSMIGVLDAVLVNGYGVKSAAGWTKAFSGTNVAVYRQGTGSNQFYLRVDNSTNAVASGVIGYETMSNVNTGTGPFPTDGQVSGGLFMRQSASTDATARAWLIAADEKRFFFWVNSDNAATSGLSTAAGVPAMYFGDIFSDVAGDAYHTVIIASTNTPINSHQLAMQTTSIGSAIPGHFMARASSQLGGSIQVLKTCTNMVSSNPTIGAAGLGYPDPATTGLVLLPIIMQEFISANLTIRGRLPGLWGVAHSNTAGNPGDTLSGSVSGGLNGKTFVILDVAAGSGRGRLALETSNTIS